MLAEVYNCDWMKESAFTRRLRKSSTCKAKAIRAMMCDDGCSLILDRDLRGVLSLITKNWCFSVKMTRFGTYFRFQWIQKFCTRDGGQTFYPSQSGYDPVSFLIFVHMNAHARRTDTEFKAPPDTIYTGHFAGDLYSQLLDWYKQKTKQFKTINNFSSTNQWSSSLMWDNVKRLTATEYRDSVIRQWRTRYICNTILLRLKTNLGGCFEHNVTTCVLSWSRAAVFECLQIWRHNYVISRNGHSIFTCPMTHIPLVYSLDCVYLCRSRYTKI